MRFRSLILFLVLVFLEKTSAQTLSEKFKTWSDEELAGQLLVVGMKSLSQVEKLHPGGVILFSWNMPSVVATQKLTEALAKLSQKARVPLMVATDHEGGEVIRLRKGVTNFPDAAAVGATKNPDIAYEIGLKTGQELRALGINTNFAPVLDLGNAKSFLRNRVWGSHPVQVASMTSAYIRGLTDARVLSVAKHFPGHGSTTVDSHLNLPVSPKKLSQLWRSDLNPFREAIRQNVPALMTAHVELSSVERVPASFSKRLLSGLLRDKMNYQGLIITDDLEMGGARMSEGELLSEKAIKALQAGSDMVMLVWDQVGQFKVRDEIVRAIHDGRLPRDQIYTKLERIIEVKQRFHGEGVEGPAPLASVQTQKLVSKVIRAAVKWRGGDESRVIEALKGAEGQGWDVFLPNAKLASSWKKRRPQDRIVVLKHQLLAM